MVTEERAAFFHECENQFPVDEWKIEDVEIWPLIKFEINKILKAKNETFSQTERKSNKISFLEFFKEGISLIKFPFYFLIDRKKNQNYNKNAEVVFLTQSTRRSFVNKSYFDRICDPYIEVLENMKKEYMAIEWTYDHNYKIPRAYSSKLIQPTLDFIGLKSILFKKRHFNFNKLDKWKEFLKFLDKKVIDHQSLIKTFNSSLNLMFLYAEYFKKKLELIKPKYAFLFPFFGIVGSAFILACRRLGITSVDIQHGFYHKNEPLYYGIQKIPESGYKLLPNIFWCWDEQNKKGIESWNKDVSGIHRAFVGGNLWINKWKKSDNFFLDSIKTDHEYYKNDDSRVKLLITFSPFYLIPEWLSSAVKETEESCIFGLRFHHNTPKEILKKMKRQFEDCHNVEYQYANDLSLPAVLMFTDIHVTIASSCLIEAKELGVPTILVSNRTEPVYAKEIEEGWTARGYSKDDFLNSIDKLKDFKWETYGSTPSNTLILEHFFKSYE